LTAPGEAIAWLREAVATPTDECVDWPFSCDRYGYPQVRYMGRVRRAHHVARELVGRAAPPAGMDGRHTCGRAVCINPRHSEDGTRSANEADKVRHGTSNRGERCGAARLTADQVQTIRKSSETSRVLADAFGVGTSTIDHIRHRRTWRWLPEEETSRG